MRKFKTISAETPEKFDKTIAKFYEDNPDLDAPINAEFSTSSVAIMSKAPVTTGNFGPPGAHTANVQVITVYSVTIEYEDVNELAPV